MTKRTRRQLTIEALTRVIDQAKRVEQALVGYDDPLAHEVANGVRAGLERRRKKLLALLAKEK